MPSSCDIALVHDGARPLISQALIQDCLQAIRHHGAAIAAIPVKDTLKRASDEGIVETTIQRDKLWRAQTPQGATVKLFTQCFSAVTDQEVTDEASLFELCGHTVHLVNGSETNIKITQPEDLIMAEKILMTEAHLPVRIGHGFDAHRFAPERALVLGGETIGYHLGLAAHSDGDVVCHALCDGILGALGLRDIGHHFPDSAAKFKDINSILLLEQVIALMSQRGYVMGNTDITIICQAPKLAPYIEKMRTHLAAACNCAVTSLNIKATTTENMGFTGRGEGISCHAVVCLYSTKRSNNDNI